MTAPSSKPLMIFSAGLGTRMRPLTDTRPKPLIPVGGVTMIDRAVGLGTAAGCQPIVSNVHYLAEQMTSHLHARGITVSDESDNLLDTGGGLKRALPMLGGRDVFTLNPDVLWFGPNPLTLLAEQWQGRGALLLLVHLDQTYGRVGGGDFTLEDGRITRGGPLVYTGAQVISSDAVADTPGDVFSLNVVWNRLAEQGQLQAAVYPGQWCDLGTPEALETAEGLLSA